MTEGATTVSCIDETAHHKSSLAPDESIEMPALRNTSIVDVHIQEKHEQVIYIHIYIPTNWYTAIMHHTHTQYQDYPAIIALMATVNGRIVTDATYK